MYDKTKKNPTRRKNNEKETIHNSAGEELKKLAAEATGNTVTIDGQKYYTQWSNKAWRTAK